MARTKEEHSRENKERYYWYKERGVCVTCGRTWSEPGHVRCKTCEAKMNACQVLDRERRIKRKAARRQELIAKGLCTECGNRPATEGMRMCPRCRAMRMESSIKYRIHQRTLKGESR